MEPRRKYLLRSRTRDFCFGNLIKFLKSTSLHGLRFIGDDSLTGWERGFFLCAVLAALAATGNFISYIFTKWESTPIIIGVNPYPTSVADIPFPAITLCNLNQLVLDQVANFSKDSYEGTMVDIACFLDSPANGSQILDSYKTNPLSIPDFLVKYTPSCASNIVSCQWNSIPYNCSDLFHETLTDEGLCCVFNIVHPVFRLKGEYTLIKDYTTSDGTLPVDWNPEDGFGPPTKLPRHYYPRPARGIGVSMGLTLVLNAQLDDYFCSSTNGPGFKLELNNPIETPRVRDNGLTVGVGEEVRFRVDAHSSMAEKSIRSLDPLVRRCLFMDEGNLKFYKYYTRRNCENECQANYLYRKCRCIPYNLPLLFENATVCGAPQHHCVNKAQFVWLTSQDEPCRRKCLSSCFDVSYVATAFTAPLVQGDYKIQNENILKNYSRAYIKKNISIVHFYFREFVFHGEVRNVYIGFTEFLSNSGGILGLFMGFSFISLSEVFYFFCVRPVLWWIKPSAQTKVKSVDQVQNHGVQHVEEPYSTYWLGNKFNRPKKSANDLYKLGKARQNNWKLYMKRIEPFSVSKTNNNLQNFQKN